MKLAGAVCILAGTLLGYLTGRRERRRRRAALADLERALVRLAEEIRLARAPLPGLLERLAAACGPDAGAFFRDTADGLRRGEPAEPAWRHAAEGAPVSAEARRILADAGTELRGDEARLRRGLLTAAERLAACGAALDAARPMEERRRSALALSGAALLAILLY